MASKANKIETIKQHIKSYSDFPKPGILFRDFFSVLQNPETFRLLKEVLVEEAKMTPVDIVVGLESRGFIVGALVAIELGVPFVPIRKKGKLPGKLKSVKYELEYGEDEFEIQENSIKPNDKVLILDDLLATGGTLAAAVELVKSCQAHISQCLVVMELVELRGREKVNCNVHSLISY